MRSSITGHAVFYILLFMIEYFGLKIFFRRGIYKAPIVIAMMKSRGLPLFFAQQADLKRKTGHDKRR